MKKINKMTLDDLTELAHILDMKISIEFIHKGYSNPIEKALNGTHYVKNGKLYRFNEGIK